MVEALANDRIVALNSMRMAQTPKRIDFERYCQSLEAPPDDADRDQKVVTPHGFTHREE